MAKTRQAEARYWVRYLQTRSLGQLLARAAKLPLKEYERVLNDVWAHIMGKAILPKAPKSRLAVPRSRHNGPKCWPHVGC